MKRRLAVPAAAVALIIAVPVIASAAGSPTVTTGAPSSVHQTWARASGTVNPNGEATTYAFQYGPTRVYGQQTREQSAGSGTTAQKVTSTLANLRPGTVYHYRIVATNPTGTSAGADGTFRTTGTAPPPSPTPSATTQPATGTGRHGGTLNGTVDAKGTQTSYYFEFGLTTAYGLRTNSQTLPPGTTIASVRGILTGLEAGKTYHFRLVATNAGGSSVGHDLTFRTVPQRVRPRQVTATTTPRRDRTLPYVFTTTGRIRLPRGVSRSAGCRGTVSVRFKAGRKTISLRRARVSRSCHYRSRVKFDVRSRLRPRRLKVTERFNGNGVLSPRSGPRHFVRVG